MVYDLTTVLTTIASASASIVAILGGFIASKLITISSERAAALDRVKKLTKNWNSMYRKEISSKQRTMRTTLSILYGMP